VLTENPVLEKEMALFTRIERSPGKPVLGSAVIPMKSHVVMSLSLIDLSHDAEVGLYQNIRFILPVRSIVREHSSSSKDLRSIHQQFVNS